MLAMDRRRHRYAEVEYEQRHRDGKYAIAQRSQTFGALAGNPVIGGLRRQVSVCVVMEQRSLEAPALVLGSV